MLADVSAVLRHVSTHVTVACWRDPAVAFPNTAQGLWHGGEGARGRWEHARERTHLVRMRGRSRES